MSDVQHAFRQSVFCRSLPVDIVDRLGEMSQPLTLPADTTLFDEGERHSQVYLVLDGRIRLDLFIRARDRVELITVGAGEFLGWSPLLFDLPMTVRARAATECTLLAFSAEELRLVCEKDFRFGYYFMKQLAGSFTRRLNATRLQMLDVFGEAEAISESSPSPVARSE